jgi:hypothetical protein
MHAELLPQPEAMQPEAMQHEAPPGASSSEASGAEMLPPPSRPAERMPRPRDIWIFDEIVLFGRKQRDVARELGMTQPRVSQIVHQMVAWLARQINHQPSSQPAQDWRLFIPRLAHLRSQAEADGRVPATSDPARAVEQALAELLGLNS